MEKETNWVMNIDQLSIKFISLIWYIDNWAEVRKWLIDEGILPSSLLTTKDAVGCLDDILDNETVYFQNESQLSYFQLRWG